MTQNLLSINNLTVSFQHPKGELTAVKGVSLSLDKGETLALVGESGCGKTVLCKSMLKLLCEKGRIRQGRILLEGRDLVPIPEKDMETCRGSDIAMVFQDPMTGLDPAFSVGEQIAEVLRQHRGMNRSHAKAQAVELMELVQIPEAKRRYDQRPYQFSGGMRQRIVIAIALAGQPKLLLADEPTTALDEETQAEILKLLKDIQQKTGVAILFITHDLSLVEDMAHRVAIMQDGVIVEEGWVEEVFAAPRHPYTRKLLGYLDYKKDHGHNHRGNSGVHYSDNEMMRKSDNALPNSIDKEKNMSTAPILTVRSLTKSFYIGKGRSHKVLDGFDLELYRGEIVGLVGRSGCGKSTLARCIMGIEPFDKGSITVGVEDQQGYAIDKADGFNTAAPCYSKSPSCNLQMIFQDSPSAFNDRMTVEEIIAETLRIRKKGVGRQSFSREYNDAKDAVINDVVNALAAVELDPSMAERKPYELSGGQRQRVAIARAIITEPDLIIADEPLTGLDVSAQAQIVHLFKKLATERSLTILFIAHDLPMVNHISDRVIQMETQ